MPGSPTIARPYISRVVVSTDSMEFVWTVLTQCYEFML